MLEERGDDDTGLHGQQTHRVLLVLGQTVKQRYELCFDVLDLDHFDEFAELGGRRSPHHGRVVRAQIAEKSAQVHLGRVAHALIAYAHETARGRARCKPVTLGETLEHGHEVLLQVGVGVLGRQITERVHGFVAHHRLLHGGQTLQRSQKTVNIVGTTHQRRELA